MRFKVLPAVLLMAVLGWTQAKPAKKAAEQSEDHQPSIHGIRIGMTTEQVLNVLGGRMPDLRKDEKEEIIVFWKMEKGDVLQVNFRKENYVSHIALQFKPPRPTADLWLLPLKSSGTTTELSARDPRLRVDYRASETGDKERTAWIREEKSTPDYRIDVTFLSASRLRLGERFESEIEFKYVSVNRNDLKKFDQVMTGKK
ncbi:MAG: hypothetical protein ACRD2Q_06480 [Terriglobales bacterium]